MNQTAANHPSAQAQLVTLPAAALPMPVVAAGPPETVYKNYPSPLPWKRN